MEKEKIEIVLADILDELRNTNNAMQEHKQQIVQLQERTRAFQEKIIQLNQSASPAVDSTPLEATINATSFEIKQAILQQSKPIIREWRVLLFPENYTREYYTVIFRLLMWMTLVCVGAFLFSLGSQALENSKEIKLRQLENDQYKNAWEYMYNDENKQGKKKMEDAWQKSWKRQLDEK